MTHAINPDEDASLLQFGEFDRILARLADTAVERACCDNRTLDVALIAIERHNVGHLARTILAERSSAKNAHSVRRSFAVPAVHSDPPEESGMRVFRRRDCTPESPTGVALPVALW